MTRITDRLGVADATFTEGVKTMDHVEKVKRLLQPDDCEWCFAVPGSDSIIDVLIPGTNRTACFGHTLEEVRADRPEYAGAVLMFVDDFCAEKAARQHAPITWAETTEANFYEMLGTVPPALMLGGGFLVGEAWDHDASNGQPRFQGFREADGKHFVSSRAMTRAEFRASVTA